MPNDQSAPSQQGRNSPSTSPQPAQPEEGMASHRCHVLPYRYPVWARILHWILDPWLGLRIEADTAEIEPTRQPIVYVLEDYGLSNALILDKACSDLGLPSPVVPLACNPFQRQRAYLALSRRSTATGFLPEQRGPRTHSDSLAKLLHAHRIDLRLDVQLVPVSIFVGRAPDRQSSWFSLLFSENWTFVGRFRRLIAILLNGRSTIVRFAAPISVRETLKEGLSPERTVRKLQRVLRAHFRRIREAVIGPDLSTRRLLVDQVLAAETVREAIAAQAKRDRSKPIDAWRKAQTYAWEIAADYSNPIVRSLGVLLSNVWNRIYAGVLVHHLDEFKQAAPGHEIVYVPCHRSHMDYLLLSYFLYEHGIVPPHIVAGINLNIPIVGTLLRKSGAFFIRRTIRGNALYSAVLGEYVAQLVAGGYSLEYFIEGGRSRTGRLLQPKVGMLAMTLRAYLRSPRKSVLFQPIYIGYEKLMEGNSYLDELAGRPKKKESIWALLLGIPRVLKTNYGQVVVNFAEPIPLDTLLTQMAPDWDGSAVADDVKPAWFSGLVDQLSTRIQTNINSAADVNPINLLALALLSTPKFAMGEADLIAQIAFCKKLLTKLPFSDLVTVTPHSPERIIAHAEQINVLVRTKHPLGDVLSVSGNNTVLLSYFRNNVLHLFTVSSWIACCFQNNRRLSHAGLTRLSKTVYPFLKAELFLPWSDQQFIERVERVIRLFIQEGLIERSEDEDGGGILTRHTDQADEIFRMRAIGHSLQQAFERYYITISVLVKNGPGSLSSGELEGLCQLAAQRLSLLYASTAPEFFDRALFRIFIQKLRELTMVWPDSNSKLLFDERLDTWAKDAKFILGRELRHTIERISPEATSSLAHQNGPRPHSTG